MTFAFFTDFGLTFDTNPNQLKQSPSGLSVINSPSYGCPTFINGACFGGQQVTFPANLATVPGTNLVPRMSNGAELQVILPIVNAPFRIFYAYNSSAVVRGCAAGAGSSEHLLCDSYDVLPEHVPELWTRPGTAMHRRCSSMARTTRCVSRGRLFG